MRYNCDGYGNKADGGAYRGWGQGRVWPLLTGERAHYEPAAGKDISELIKTYERFATSGQMMPEQVWDNVNVANTSMQLGRPAGSAVPLVWAHAEYLKLLRSAVDGKVFDRINLVYQPYCEPKGRKKKRTDLEIFSLKRPIQRIRAGSTLRIVDANRFEVAWSANGWKTTQGTANRGLGSAGYSADIMAEKESSEISFTLRWTEADTWLGHNVDVKIDTE